MKLEEELRSKREIEKLKENFGEKSEETQGQ